MGQFSWCCAVCDQEVMHGRQPGFQWTTDAVILWPNGDKRTGRYEEGYGNIAGVNLVDQMGGWRLTHQRCFENVMHLNTADMFANFHAERHAGDQGWWPGERRAVIQFGEPERSELTETKSYVCYECNRTWKATWSGGLCPFGCVRPKNYRDPEKTVAKGTGDWREMVEPFAWIGGSLDYADGVIVCRNETEERTDWDKFHAMSREEREANPPKKTEPCFRFGEPQQSRVTKPAEWDEFDRPERGEFTPRCRSCKTENVEVVALTRATAP